jgi:hypothetical protein
MPILMTKWSQELKGSNITISTCALCVAKEAKEEKEKRERARRQRHCGA